MHTRLYIVPQGKWLLIYEANESQALEIDMNNGEVDLSELTLRQCLDGYLSIDLIDGKHLISL